VESGECDGEGLEGGVVLATDGQRKRRVAGVKGGSM